MLSNAYCFCPHFLSIVPTISVIDALVSKRHSIFLDEKNILMEEYTRVLSQDAESFTLCVLLQNGLNDTQKLISPVNSNQISSNLLLETLTGFETTDTKFLASSDRQMHRSLLPQLQQLSIREIYPHNFSLSYNSNLHRAFDISEFIEEIEHSLYLVMGERKGKLENEYNTTLANCLRAKRYIVLDQTLHGRSLSGISMGSLDLVIQDGTYKTIIEPLRLSGMASEPFYSHLNKLLDNYNPLRIKHTFLVTYYRGRRNNFLNFVNDYKDRLDDLDLSQLNQSSEWEFSTSNIPTSNYEALYKIEQRGTLNGSPFTCIHLIADFSEN
ncbi:TPA: hypothetical protein ACVO0I_004006 [Vibrio diabolicus]